MRDPCILQGPDGTFNMVWTTSWEGKTIGYASSEFWQVYFDKYRERRYGMVRSRDLKTWEDWSDKVSFPDGARHGTVFAVPAKILARLLEQ